MTQFTKFIKLFRVARLALRTLGEEKEGRESPILALCMLSAFGSTEGISQGGTGTEREEVGTFEGEGECWCIRVYKFIKKEGRKEEPEKGGMGMGRGDELACRVHISSHFADKSSPSPNSPSSRCYCPKQTSEMATTNTSCNLQQEHFSVC